MALDGLISAQYKSPAQLKSIRHKHYFSPPIVWTEAAWFCVCGKVNCITSVTAPLFPPLIQWIQFLYTAETEARAIISQLIYSSAGQRTRFKPQTMQTCVALEWIRFRPQHCKNTRLYPSRWQRWERWRKEGRIWLKDSYFTFFHESAEWFWFRMDDIIAQKASLSDWWCVR